MCENLFDNVSQKVSVCIQCGDTFEGDDEFCSSYCEDEYHDEEDDD